MVFLIAGGLHILQRGPNGWGLSLAQREKNHPAAIKMKLEKEKALALGFVFSGEVKKNKKLNSLSPHHSF